MVLVSQIHYVGRDCDVEEHRVAPADPTAEDEEILASVEWQCQSAEVAMRSGKFKQAVQLLRRSFTGAEKQIAIAKGAGPAAQLALALIRLQLCAVLASLDKRTQMISEAQIALVQVDSVWRTLLQAVIAANSAAAADPLAILLKQPPSWLDLAAEAAVRGRLYVAMATEAIARQAGGIEAILASEARARGEEMSEQARSASRRSSSEESNFEESVLSASRRVEHLYRETLALATHLLPEAHPLLSHVERAYEELDLPLEVPPPQQRRRAAQQDSSNITSFVIEPPDLRILDTSFRLPKTADAASKRRRAAAGGLSTETSLMSRTQTSQSQLQHPTASDGKPPTTPGGTRPRRQRVSPMPSVIPGTRAAGLDPFEAWKRSVSDHMVMTPFQRSLQSEEGIRFLQDTLRHQSKMFKVVVLKHLQDHEPERLQENRTVYSNAALITKRQAEKRMEWWKTAFQTEELKPKHLKEKQQTEQLFRHYGVRYSNSEPSLKHFVKLMEISSPAEKERKRLEAEEKRRRELEERRKRDAEKVALMQGKASLLNTAMQIKRANSQKDLQTGEYKPGLVRMGTGQWISESSGDEDEMIPNSGELGIRFTSMARKSVKKNHDI
eukprot:CAMPEP_0178396700 /NCGR_PEP_ID=MMETSP0689_2-20121128/13862_1 /TAXON_ID=160604 /ORGANISM="Amphidinium massartii, Strain CS-259" /LENGTH=611 /DNA_ID=CAMNT_0020017379 /DNA_START=31 /DNA_END=1863 /DNA_ORIENTATION=+